MITEAQKTTMFQARQLLNGLSWFANFMGPAQRFALLAAIIESDEGPALAQLVLDAANAIRNTPVTYQTQDVGSEEKRLCLHYFRGGADAWIVERDIGDVEFDPRDTPISSMPADVGLGPQLQAFGKVGLFGGGWRDAEWGYVSIKELIEARMELDLYWVVKSAGEMK